MELALRPRSYRLGHRFTISQGAMEAVDVVEVQLSGDGPDAPVGRGESSPSKRVAGVGPADCPPILQAWWDDRPDSDLPRTPAEAAFAGLDAALLDRVGRRDELPVHRLLDLPAAEVPTSMTISLGPVDAMVEEALRHADAGFTHLKVKVGEGPADVERIAALRDALPDATIRVDANGGWTAKQAAEVLPKLARHDVEMVEQPLARGDDGALAELRAAGDDATGGLPLYADESLVRPDDLAGLEDRYDGVVVKLNKHGGPRPSKALLERARALGLSTMLGCNVVSSLGIAPAAHLLALSDLADLDGALLLADDGWRGVPIEDGRIRTPDGPGLGVEPVDAAAGADPAGDRPGDRGVAT